MVMDDLALKGVMDPSSIWTVICMLLNGSKACCWRVRMLQMVSKSVVFELSSLG